MHPPTSSPSRVRRVATRFADLCVFRYQAMMTIRGMHAERCCVCFVQWEGPDEPARGATYPTRGSELTERDPRARGWGCGQRVFDVGRRSTPTREIATCRGYEVLLSRPLAKNTYLESDFTMKPTVPGKRSLPFSTINDLFEISCAFASNFSL